MQAAVNTRLASANLGTTRHVGRNNVRIADGRKDGDDQDGFGKGLFWHCIPLSSFFSHPYYLSLLSRSFGVGASFFTASSFTFYIAKTTKNDIQPPFV